MIEKNRRIKSDASLKPPKKVGRPAKKLKQHRTRIQSKEVYELTMKEIDALMKKGEEHLTPKTVERLRVLAEAAENYENTHEHNS